MYFDEVENDKISKLSPFMKIVFNTLHRWINQLLNGDCDEDTISDAASKINSSTTGYVHEDDYVTLDEAMRILNFGQNRVGCLSLMRRNGIKCEKFNNLSIGYNRDKVVALKKKMNKK